MGGVVVKFEVLCIKENRVSYTFQYLFKLTKKEKRQLNLKRLDYDGDYDYTIERRQIKVTCELDKGELGESESLDERTKLITKDLSNRILGGR